TMSRADVMLLMEDPDLPMVESLYETAIETTRQFGLDMVQLQASTRLVSLRRRMGAHPDGSDELAAVYASFQSGQDEPDLVAAAALLR
ncbi:MAG TPA: hypothetical protein VF115_02045, partial [Acidimicrobiia bacterium]